MLNYSEIANQSLLETPRSLSEYILKKLVEFHNQPTCINYD